MVTPEVGEVAKARLRAAGSHVVPVDMITPANWKIAASWWETVFTKLQIFSLRNTSAGIVDQVRDSTARKRARAHAVIRYNTSPLSFRQPPCPDP